MFVQEKIASKKFIGGTSKEAYLKACRWIYDNIYMSQDETFKKLEYTIEAMSGEGLPTCRLTIYVKIEEEEIRDTMCRACEDVHKLFYFNNVKECATCKLEPYRKRLKDRLGVVDRYYVDELFRKGKDKEW